MQDITIKVIVPPESIADAEFVRAKVFQEEQGIDRELDFDGRDHEATHIIVYAEGKPVGAGRIRTIENKKVKIERIAVLAEMRGKGVGKLIMKAIDDYLLKSKIRKATLDSQYHAKGFYESMGYVQEGDIFKEVGIPHVVMIKQFK